MDDDHRREVMDALGERTRYDIVVALIKKELTGDEIAAAVGRSRSTVESHLSMLLRLGLISREMRDRVYYYHATPLSIQYLEGAPDTGAPPPATDRSEVRGQSYLWAVFSTAAGALYFIINQYVYPFHIFGMGILFGIASAFLLKSLRDVVKATITTAFVISFLAYLIPFSSSPIAFFASFTISLVYISIGLALWLLIRSFRRTISRIRGDNLL
ncbi:MAG: winged helix-turn-helix transcriptional regulator [Candidatus Methanosuratus sp.]|nr:winged helix-turn-helix transcriptional regulator [Candidatus Methanosuratincola sp.]